MRCKSILVPPAEEVDPASSVSEDQLSHALGGGRRWGVCLPPVTVVYISLLPQRDITDLKRPSSTLLALTEEKDSLPKPHLTGKPMQTIKTYIVFII